MKVIITTDQGRLEQLVWEKAPFQPAYKLRLEINGEIVYRDTCTPYTRDFVARSLKAARGVVGVEQVAITKG